MGVGMKRSYSVFALFFCLYMAYHTAAGWEGQTVFPSGSAGKIYEEGKEAAENKTASLPGKKYSAEFAQEERAYTVTAVDTRETCWEEGGEYSIFRVCVRDGAGNTVQEFGCKIPVMHVVSLEFDDLNFDGFPDLKIGYSNWKNDTNYCSVHLWNEGEGKFGGEKICIPMEYEKAEEQKMFRAVSRQTDAKRQTICRIGEDGKLDMLRWWETDEEAHWQTIGDFEEGKILYEGPWGRKEEEDFENEEDYEDIFWSGLRGEGEPRVWWECGAGGGQIVLQDLIPDKSLKLIFYKDGKEKIVRIFQKHRDYGNQREYTGGIWEALPGQEGIYLWDHIYPKWRHVEYYVLADSASGEKELYRLDKDWTSGQEKTRGRKINEKRKKSTEPEIQQEMKRKLEFAEKLLQSDGGFDMNREEYLAVYRNMPVREATEEYEKEREVRVHRAAVGDLDGDGMEDRAFIGVGEKGGYQLYIWMGKADGAGGFGEELSGDLSGGFVESLRMMNDECLYHSEISILGNRIIIAGKGGRIFRGFQMVVFEWKEDGGARAKLLLNGERERDSSEVHWEIRDYGTGERKFFSAEDTGTDIVEVCSLEEYLERRTILEEPGEETVDEMKVYGEFLKGERGLYVKADSLYWGVNRFSAWDEYTLEDILDLLQMDYWMDGGGADREIAEMEYAYLDCGGDGFHELAVRLTGMGICGAGDDSSITFLISCKSGRLELCYAFENWCRSWTDMYYYGFVDSGGSNGASNYAFDELFLDADCEKQVIFEANRTWGLGGLGNYGEDFEKIFADGEELHVPDMSMTSYWIGERSYWSYEIEATEMAEAEKCEEFMEVLRRNGEKIYTEAEIGEIVRDRRRELGIKEEWMERKELQWEKMEKGK